MSPWKGWDEEAVRGSSSAISPPRTMTGFTAINAPNSDGATNGSASRGMLLKQEADTSFGSQQGNATSVVSEYLGRGESDETAIRKEALHGPGSKKAPAKNSKKRASTTSSRTTAKRRKTSDVAADMPVTKTSNIRTSKAAGKKSNARKDDTIEPAAVSPMAAEKVTSQTQVHVANDRDAMGSSAKPVSLYTSSTSMSTLSTTSQPTSIDSVRSSAGHGTTLYNSKGPQDKKQRRVQVTQPWSNRKIDDPAQTGPAAHTRSLRPRKGKPTSLLASPRLDEEEVIISPVKKTKSIRGRKTKARRLSSEEDLLGDEDDIDDMLNLANNIETGATATRKVQLPTPVNSDAASQSQAKPTKAKKRKPTPVLTPDEEFLELGDSDEAEMIDLTETAEEEDDKQKSPIPPPRERKLNTHTVDMLDDYGGAFLSEAERRILDGLKTTSAAHDSIKPVVRKPFPTPILDRSPIFGASNQTVLAACFRIGEALNIGCQAVRANRDVVLELYARVSSSWREPKPGRKQHFVFRDLYHDNPPYLEGTFDLCDQSRLWDLDSKAFLVPKEGGRMCRAVAKMKRDGMKWRLDVLSVWEASWEDVEYVAGVYAKHTEPKEE